MLVKDRILDVIDDIRYFIEDNGQIVGAGVLVVIAIVVGFLFINNSSGEDSEEVAAETDLVVQQQENAMYYFSELNESNMGTEEEVVLEVDVYLKRPLQSNEGIQEALNDLVQVYQYKYDRDNVSLKGLQISLYDRIEQYEQETDAMGMVYYTPDMDTSLEVVYGGDEIPEGASVDYQDIMWEASQIIEPKDINYDTYTLSVNYEGNEDVDKPYTNEEYRFFLKLNRYKVFTGDWEDAIQKYLEWEEGVVNGLTVSDMVIRGYMQFVNRMESPAVKSDFYEGNDSNVRSEMLIRNPQWVYYLETGEYTESEIEALRGVVEHSREYLDLLVDFTLNSEEMELIKEDFVNSLNTIVNEGTTSDVQEETLNESLNELRDSLDEDGTHIPTEPGDEASEEAETEENSGDSEESSNTEGSENDEGSVEEDLDVLEEDAESGSEE